MRTIILFFILSTLIIGFHEGLDNQIQEANKVVDSIDHRLDTMESQLNMVMEQNDPERIIDYDWQNDRYITLGMTDSLIFTGGKWQKVNEIPKPRVISTHPKKPSKWIKKSGKYHRDNSKIIDYNKEDYSNDKPLTEDDLRQLIITEYDR